MKQKNFNQETDIETIALELLGISYEEGKKYFGAMFDKIVSSIEKTEKNLAKLAEEN